ncbi:DUF1643 domain-containing protein [Pseudomonas paralcaligenes]|uniref:DUF1643 domain-containing protein n=1 Tax=Pseudomonas paralcaligenes TaxID=2772558 RepID=UPI0021CEF033|nr:DUF1643 domain-containing protein [Pseudomonas paralcaligenes]
MSAIISECGQYRYRLTRQAEQLFPMASSALFVMLNPSTADASLDDPTIRRCRGFARAWDCAGIVVANLYALRATNPADLWPHADPVGPENDQHLLALADDFGDVVCAWGAHAKPERVERVVQILQGMGARLWCLGTNKDGSPRHPLYLPASQPLVPWLPTTT